MESVYVWRDQKSPVKFRVLPGALRGLPSRVNYKPPSFPSVLTQADALGARLQFVEPSYLSSDPQHYNGSLVRDDRGLWLVWRNHNYDGNSTIRTVMLNEDLVPIKSTAALVVLPSLQEYDEQWEDPRAFKHSGSVWISYTSLRQRASCTAIAVSRLDPSWRAVDTIKIPYGRNWSDDSIQKNWIFFEYDGALHFTVALL